MRNKINLTILLMAFCTLFLVGLQLHWNYQSYKSDSRVFKSNINSSLEKAVVGLMDLRRADFTERYKKWLSDTSLIEISCHYNDTAQSTVFYIKDKHPPYKNRPPFPIGLEDFNQHLKQITPAAKMYFIDHFTKTLLQRDLKSGSAYFYTERLGDSLARAFRTDKINVAQLIKLYNRELNHIDINNEFNIELTTYESNGFATSNNVRQEGTYSTQMFKYGFSTPFWAVKAIFPDPNLIFLEKMKWVLLSSMILIGMTIASFTHTVKTLLSQRKLTELKDDFVNNMTHELKTPVATISIAAEAMQDLKLSRVSTEEYLSIIRYQARNLTNLINQILKSMLSEQTMIHLNRVVISLWDVLNTCIEQYQPQLKAANVSINLDVREKFILVKADAAHLANVIANLLDNAIKYGEQNQVIQVQLYSKQQQAVLKITNTGPCIPEKYQNRIFERFFRVPMGNIHDVKGYGLGLSYVRDIISQHGGSITVNSQFARTTFTIQLPLAR